MAHRSCLCQFSRSLPEIEECLTPCRHSGHKGLAATVQLSYSPVEGDLEEDGDMLLGTIALDALVSAAIAIDDHAAGDPQLSCQLDSKG
jgi:hypothetical protein